MNKENHQGTSAEKFNLIPTMPYPELPEVLTELVRGVMHILSDNLTGVYLVGSLATGGFDADSDVDFLVVVKDDLDPVQLKGIQDLHREIYGKGSYPAQHLEGSYIKENLLANKKTLMKQKIWYLDNGSSTLERTDHDNRWHVHWVLRERGITLYGPNPKTFITPIPVNELHRDVIKVMDQIAVGFRDSLTKPLDFYNSRFGQSFVILTVCRILHTLQTDKIESKFAGITWAKKKLGPKWRNIIDQAWQEREGVRYCVKIKQRASQILLVKTMQFIDYAKSFNFDHN